MGIFSSIKRRLKKIWKGVKKVFKKIMKPIGKFLNSKLGKILMIGVSVFTLGSSLLAGFKGFASAGKGFIGKFINGGKEFLNSLIGTNFQTVGNSAGQAAGAAGQAAGAAGQAAGQGAGAAGELLAGADGAASVAGSAASGVAEAAGALGGGAAPGAAGVFNPQGLTQAAGAAGGVAQAAGAAGNVAKAASGGWLSKAADAAIKFAGSDSGRTIIGNVLQGAAAGAQQRDQQRYDSRIERMFDDPNNAGVQELRNRDYTIDAPRNADTNYTRQTNEASGRYTPNITYRPGQPMPTGG